MRPLIGITTSIRYETTGAETHTSFGPNAYAIEKAGGLPVLIPSGLNETTLRALYDRVDAIFVPGGGDVNPSRYHAEPHPLTDGIVDARDEVEITLIRWAFAEDRPLLGVCRGHQVVNVALGGILIQDIPSQVDTMISHRHRPVTYPQDGHLVTIDPNSRLASILGTTEVEVNTLHHQCVDQPAPSLVVTAHAPDGIIEAAEAPDKHFVLSVQWHPEMMESATMLRLFTAFVEAAREAMLHKARLAAG